MLSFAARHWLTPQAHSLWWGSAIVEEMPSGYVMKHANKIYIYQITAQGLMLHKPNSRALCEGISLISAEDGFLS